MKHSISILSNSSKPTPAYWASFDKQGVTEELELTPHAFYEKVTSGHNYVACTGGLPMKAENVTGTQVVSIDIDGTSMELSEIQEKLDCFLRIIMPTFAYPTWSDMKDPQSENPHRFSLVYITEQEIHS